MYDCLDEMQVHAKTWHMRAVPVLEVDGFTERKKILKEIQSPDGKKICTVECEWGKKNKEWYFISMVCRRSSIDEIPINGGRHE